MQARKKEFQWVRWIGIAGVLVTLGTGMTAYGAELSQMTIQFEDDFSQEGVVSEPNVTAGSSLEIDDVRWSRDADSWKPGKREEVTITLSSGSGKTFASSYSRIQCRVEGADFISAKSPDSDTLIVRAEYTAAIKLGQTEQAGFSDSAKTKAVWKKVEHAPAYQIKLYENDALVKTFIVDTNSADLSAYMTKQAKYRYMVRAVAKTGAEQVYLKDGEFVDSEDTVLLNQGELAGSWRNYQDGSKYLDENGIFVTDGWKLISGSWYYFDMDGYTVKGWKQINNVWYYLNSDGTMLTGWLQYKGHWYYFNNTGGMATGWVEAQPDKWYFLGGDGVLLVGTVTPDGYQVDETGLWTK